MKPSITNGAWRRVFELVASGVGEAWKCTARVRSVGGTSDPTATARIRKANAGHIPAWASIQDVMVIAFVLDLVALFFVGDAWWPRGVDVPPHPRGLRENHFNDREENVLLAISNQIAT